ncbi:hypothetical protein [Bacillus toyonensis]|uniref:hypothetical protein n=1 Tax=Bacillus toyonensis TaxID=155322 RepID=UPI0011AAF1AA|nr:hypothetical protein [Bacillus toyonensis]
MKVHIIAPKIACIKKRFDEQGYLIRVEFFNGTSTQEASLILRATRLYDEDGTIIPFDILGWHKDLNDYVDIKEEFNNWGELLELGYNVRNHSDLKNSLDKEEIEDFGEDRIFNYINEDAQNREANKSEEHEKTK